MDSATPGKKVEKRSRRAVASPYARSAVPAPASTSRFGSLLSGILSPFRSNKKVAPVVQREAVRNEEETQQLEAELDAAPPSPTPLNRRLYPNISLLPVASPPTATTNELSTPARLSSLPQRNRDSYLPFNSQTTVEPSPERVANDVLAEFFAKQGDKPLSELEQAGVMQLLQQAATKSEVNNLPTVFTPNFKRQSQTTPSQFFSPTQSTSALPSFASPSTSNLESPYRRRRPIYVGAGQSARRQRTSHLSTSTTSASVIDLAALARGDSEMNGGMGIGRSSSEGNFGELGSGVEGKRRRVGESSIPSRRAEQVPVAEKSSGRDGVATSAGDVEMADDREEGESAEGKGRAKGTSAAMMMGRPSPLWQSAKAPTSSPPAKPSSTTPSTPAKSTGTASLVLNVIQEIDASTPKISRVAVLNPYEIPGGSPISRIPRSRPARVNTPRASSAARRSVATATPAKVELSSLEKLERSMPVAYQRDSASAESTRSAVIPAPFVFGSSQIPQSTKKSSSAPPPPAPATAPVSVPVVQNTMLKKPGKLPSSKLKIVEVIQLSDSDDEEEEEVVKKGKGKYVEEDEEEDEEMDELEEEEVEDEDEMILPPVVLRRPIAKLPIASPTKSKIPQRTSSSSAFGSTTIPAFGSATTTPAFGSTATTTGFGAPITASGFSFTAPSVFEPPKLEEEKEEVKIPTRSHIRLPKATAFAPTSSKSFSAGAPKIGMTVTPSTTTALTLPTFTFAPPPPSTIVPVAPQSIEAADETSAKESAKLVDVARSPKFTFELPRATWKGKEVDQVEKGVMDLVREMSRKELPVVRL